MVTYQDNNNNGSQSIVGACLHQDIPETDENGNYPDSEQARAEMRLHLLAITNPDRTREQIPLDPTYKAEQIKKAEDYLKSEGYYLGRQVTHRTTKHNKSDNQITVKM